MRLWTAFLAVIPACGFSSSSNGDGGREIDAMPIERCFGTFPRVCFDAVADLPNAPTTLSASVDIDTDSQVQDVCDQHNDRKADFCVVAGAGFTLAANQTIRAHGAKPLVLLSTTTMTIEANSIVDVSSNRMAAPQDRGAGANPPACMTGTPPEMAGGGYGGSFGGKGGDGEQLDGAAVASGTAALALTSPPTTLRGGCAGGDGANAGGLGGHGGGAVALIAVTSITLAGNVNASGAGGRGGPATTSGGGGGGSGGMIVIDSPSSSVNGLLFANGGGGGQGGDGPANGGPSPGADGGESPMPPTAATAGSDNTKDGGAGGTGSSGTRLVGSNTNENAQNDGGGGAGGGGAGFVRGRGLPVMANIIAPPAMELP